MSVCTESGILYEILWKWTKCRDWMTVSFLILVWLKRLELILVSIALKWLRSIASPGWHACPSKNVSPLRALLLAPTYTSRDSSRITCPAQGHSRNRMVTSPSIRYRPHTLDHSAAFSMNLQNLALGDPGFLFHIRSWTFLIQRFEKKMTRLIMLI